MTGAILLAAMLSCTPSTARRPLSSSAGVLPWTPSSLARARALACAFSLLDVAQWLTAIPELAMTPLNSPADRQAKVKRRINQ